MARLQDAAKRLQSALDALERAVDSRAGAAGEADLRAALDAAQSENAALQDVTDAVAARLDQTITRLKASLES